MKLLKRKMTNLKRYWDEQTQGLVLGPHGELLGPDGRVIRPAPTKEELAAAEKKTPKIKHSKHTIDIATVTTETIPIFDSKDQRMNEMRGEVTDSLQSRKSLWDDLMDQPPVKPVTKRTQGPTTDTPSPARSSGDDSWNSIQPQQVGPLQQERPLQRAPVEPSYWEQEWREVEAQLREVRITPSTPLSSYLKLMVLWFLCFSHGW